MFDGTTTGDVAGATLFVPVIIRLLVSAGSVVSDSEGSSNDGGGCVFAVDETASNSDRIVMPKNFCMKCLFIGPLPI